MCDDCIHKGVCAHRSDCEALQASTGNYHIEQTFTLTITCKYHYPIIETPKSKLNSWKMP